MQRDLTPEPEPQVQSSENASATVTGAVTSGEVITGDAPIVAVVPQTTSGSNEQGNDKVSRIVDGVFRCEKRLKTMPLEDPAAMLKVAHQQATTRHTPTRVEWMKEILTHIRPSRVPLVVSMIGFCGGKNLNDLKLNINALAQQAKLGPSFLKKSAYKKLTQSQLERKREVSQRNWEKKLADKKTQESQFPSLPAPPPKPAKQNSPRTSNACSPTTSSLQQGLKTPSCPTTLPKSTEKTCVDTKTSACQTTSLTSPPRSSQSSPVEVPLIVQSRSEKNPSSTEQPQNPEVQPQSRPKPKKVVWTKLFEPKAQLPTEPRSVLVIPPRPKKPTKLVAPKKVYRSSESEDEILTEESEDESWDRATDDL